MCEVVLLVLGQYVGQQAEELTVFILALEKILKLHTQVHDTSQPSAPLSHIGISANPNTLPMPLLCTLFRGPQLLKKYWIKS